MNDDVVLVANDIYQEDIHRCVICNKQRVDCIKNKLPGFKLLYCKYVEAYLKYDEHSELFDYRTADWLKEKSGYSYPKVIPRHYPPYMKKENGGEMDVYAEDDVSTPHQVKILICECKLRMPQQNGKLISIGDVAQLLDKMKAVKEHESVFWEQRGFSVKVEGMIISNANGITDKANDLARTENVLKKQAELSPHWYETSDWRILGCKNLPIIPTKE
jgi:hypothetical protein